MKMLWWLIEAYPDGAWPTEQLCIKIYGTDNSSRAPSGGLGSIDTSKYSADVISEKLYIKGVVVS
jgi:hypothetical protein